MDKLGLHIIEGWSGHLGRPRLVKLMDPSPEYVAQVRAQIGPEALIIWRRWLELQPLDSPVRNAQLWFAHHLPAMQACAAYGPIVYEGYNEIADHMADAYCSFEVERLRLMQGSGLRSVVGNFSVGVPDLPVWVKYESMLQAMRGGDLLGLHEYWPDTAGLDNRWWCGRWTLVPELAGVPIVVTECGRDLVEGRGQAGWTLTTDGATYVEELRRYNDLLDRFPNVLGAAVFSTPGPGNTWSSFDPSRIWPYVVSQYSSPQRYPALDLSLPALPDRQAGSQSRPADSRQSTPSRQNYYALPIDGCLLTVEQFTEHVWRLPDRPIRMVIIHHTAHPTQDQWRTRGGWEHFKPILARNYAQRGWTAGPHVFVSDEGVGLFTPLVADGIGVTGHNRDTWHVEIVGDYSRRLPTGPTLDHAVAATALLLERNGLGIGGLTHHRALGATECPGGELVRHWDWFTSLVDQYISSRPGRATCLPGPVRVSAEVVRQAAWAACGVAYNPQAAFLRYARQQGLGCPITTEFDFEHEGRSYRGQGFARAIVYALVGAWDTLMDLEW